MELQGRKRRLKGRPKNERKTYSQKDIKKTCLSKGTGSAFKGGEFAEHNINSGVNLNERRKRERESKDLWGISKEYLRNT